MEIIAERPPSEPLRIEIFGYTPKELLEFAVGVGYPLFRGILWLLERPRKGKEVTVALTGLAMTVNSQFDASYEAGPAGTQA